MTDTGWGVKTLITATGEVRTEKKTPDWAKPAAMAKFLGDFVGAAEAVKDSEMASPDTVQVDLPWVRLFLTNYSESDLLVQFEDPWCRDFSVVLERVLREHYGDLADQFALHQEPGLRMYGLLMKGVRLFPAFSRQSFVAPFIELLSKTRNILHDED
jgi:hypothetical protein